MRVVERKHTSCSRDAAQSGAEAPRNSFLLLIRFRLAQSKLRFDGKYALIPPDNGDYSEYKAAIKKVAAMNGDI